MKKTITFIVLLLCSSLFIFAEKHIVRYKDLKIEVIPELKTHDELSVDIVITNITGHTCYIPNVLLYFESSEYYKDNVVRMNGPILRVQNESNKDLPYFGIAPMFSIPDKWEKDKFTRLGKGKSITGHITNLFNSYPSAKECEYITIYSTRLDTEPVKVQLR